MDIEVCPSPPRRAGLGVQGPGCAQWKEGRDSHPMWALKPSQQCPPLPSPLWVLEKMALSCRSTHTRVAGSHSLGTLLPQAKHPLDLLPVRTALACACPPAGHMSPDSTECTLPLLCFFSGFPGRLERPLKFHTGVGGCM